MCHFLELYSAQFNVNSVRTCESVEFGLTLVLMWLWRRGKAVLSGESGPEPFVGQSQYLAVICTLAGADLDVVHCSQSSLCRLLVDRGLNELNGVCQKECPQTNKKAFRRRRNLAQAGVKLMALPTDKCVPLLSCSRLVKLLLSAAPFFGGKVPFINTECCRENDCFERITLSFPSTNTQSTFTSPAHYSPCVSERLSNELTEHWLCLPSQTFPASPPPASWMQRKVPLNKPPRFTQLLEISFKGSVLAAERVDSGWEWCPNWNDTEWLLYINWFN